MTLQPKRLLGSLGALLYVAGAVLGGQWVAYHTGSRDGLPHYLGGSIIGAAAGAAAPLAAALVVIGARAWLDWVRPR